MAEPVQVQEAVISFRDVHKSFGSKVIYEDLDLDVYRGEVLTIIGGSGMGKSVLLKMLIRLLDADKGSITAFGHDVSAMSGKDLLKLRRRIAMLPNQPGCNAQRGGAQRLRKEHLQPNPTIR